MASRDGVRSRPTMGLAPGRRKAAHRWAGDRKQPRSPKVSSGTRRATGGVVGTDDIAHTGDIGAAALTEGGPFLVREAEGAWLNGLTSGMANPRLRTVGLAASGGETARDSETGTRADVSEPVPGKHLGRAERGR